MGKTKVLVVDDEKAAREVLKELLGDSENIDQVQEASDPVDALGKYSNFKPDLMFVDIEMPNGNGIKLLENLNNLGYKPNVIFTTAHSEYAIKAIDFNVHGYLLKPVDREKLQLSLERFWSRSSSNKNEKGSSGTIRIKYKNGYYQIPEEQILYIQANDNYSNIVSIDEEVVVSSETLGKLAERINRPTFVRAHRSFVINTNYLYKLDSTRRKCQLKAGKSQIEIPISRSGMDLLK